jgi:hypothetical protein
VVKMLLATLSTTTGFFKNVVEYTFDGAKEVRVVFFQCDWFDPINDTRVDDFGMVEVKHELRYSNNNLLLACIIGFFKHNKCTS